MIPHYKKLLGILAVLILCLSVQSVNAQSEIHSGYRQSYSSLWDHFEWIKSDRNNIHEFHGMGGYSFHSTRGFWGKVPAAELGLYGLRYNRKILEVNRRHIIEYVAELNFSIDYDLEKTRFLYGTGDFSGFGVTPLGFQFNWRKENTVQPFFKTSTGFMYLNRRFPDTRGTRFNFTLELGTGIEIMIVPNLSLTMGYKYHHMSNFFLGDINPGVDSNIFYSGITIF